MKQRLGWDHKPSEAWSQTNQARLLVGGMQIGVFNLEGWTASEPGLTVASVIRLPPEDEVYFTVSVGEGSGALTARLEELKARGGKKEAGYNSRNNNVRIYLGDAGVHCTNEGYLESLEGAGAVLGPAIPVDLILVALYPPHPTARRSLLLRDMMGFFTSRVGRPKVEEIQPWPQEGAVSAASLRQPREIPVEELIAAIAAMGGSYSDELIRRYHAATNYLAHKHFIILPGVSGTGKTLLAMLYPFAVHGYTDADTARGEDPFYFMCAVRPDWTDPSGLLGSVDVISGKYETSPFVQAMLVATAYPSSPVFVCVDEMNIAKPEHYFADVLSAMESGMPIALHSNIVPLEGTNGEEVPEALALPPNVYITGTVNVDESTQPVSDKVLDRANVIDMSDVNIGEFIDQLSTRHPELSDVASSCRDLFVALASILRSNGNGFGLRLVEEVIRYLWFVSSTGLMPAADALDSELIQKVPVKLRGSDRQRAMLGQLSTALAGYPEALAVVGALQAQLDEYGSFQTLG